MDVEAGMVPNGSVACSLCMWRARKSKPLDVQFRHELQRLSDYTNIYLAGVAVRGDEDATCVSAAGLFEANCRADYPSGLRCSPKCS